MKRPLATIIEKIEADLAYRLPTSGKPLSSVLLSREQAEELLREVYELRVRAGERDVENRN
jgi:hypothetical protein